MTFRLSLAATFFALLAASAFGQCNSNDTTAPCFANVPDILNGRQSLLQDDDLVVNGVFVNFSNLGGPPVPASSFSFTENSQVLATITTGPTQLFSPAANVVGVRGRLFNLRNDQVVTVQGSMTPAMGQNTNIIGFGLPGVTVPPLSILGNPQSLYGASGRFAGNGFDQMVFAAVQFNSPLTQIIFQAIGAVDPNNPASGLQAGAPSALINNGSSVYAMTSGVFTDPQAGQTPPSAQVALLSGNPSNGTGLTLSFFSVTSNLSIVPGTTFNLNLGASNSQTFSQIAIASGRFTGGNHDQIVVAYAAPNGSAPKAVTLVTIDFDSSGNPVQKTTYTTNAVVYPRQKDQTSSVFLQTGRFDWFNPSAQVALSAHSYLINSTNYGVGQMQIISFDQNLNATSGPAYTQADTAYHFGLAAGRFDRMQANPSPPPAMEPDPNLQLADVSFQASNLIAPEVLTIYDVNPATFAISIKSTANVVPTTMAPPALLSGTLTVSVTAADLEGRSLALGPPEKATVTGHIQPDTVLGMPPMHVDWITPAGGTTPAVVNVSVYPKTFNTAYSFESGQSGTVSRSGTTSYTASTKETVGEKISYGFPGIGSVSAQSSQAFGQMHKKTVAKKFNTYSGQSSGFTTQTKFDDVVAASSSQMNIYSYRVLGHCVTAAGAPASEGCAAGTRPLYVQYSGPDNVNYIQAAEGRNLEWYQPVQEPGNLFSYPANERQLEADLAGGTTFQPLTPTDNVWDSQTASAVVANWTMGGGSSVSTGSVASHSFDAQTSVSGSANIFGVDVSANAGFDYNSSSSVSTLNQSTSSFSNSQGITLNRGIGSGRVDLATYAYQGRSFIYGQTAPQGTIQNDLPLSTTVQAQGYIAAAHATDMLSQGGITSGNFWPQAYASAPDLALNHPQRWLEKPAYGVYRQQVQFNCPIGFTSALTSPSCTPNGQTPNPVNIADASFYQMKGLFVTPGDTTAGPQITSTTLGKKVNLRVRIYNYSLANFAAGTIMHVQFYAQPWGIGQFVSQSGKPNKFAPAVFIGNGTDSSGNLLNPVPAFCGGAGTNDPCLGSSVRNWEFAYATWDTSQGNIAPNSTWKFWVVVWAEYNGNLVTEISGHGLQSAPTAPFNSLADVPVETYSNNLGYYNQVFTVFAPVGVKTTKGNAPRLTVEDVGLRSGSTSLRDRPVTITATHLSSAEDIHSVLTLYYDGDPNKGGTLFDTQTLDRVSSKGFVDTASFYPTTCGVHKIFVRAIPLDGSVKETTTETKINVVIDTPRAIDDLIDYLYKLKAPLHVRIHLIGYLVDARRDFKEGRTSEGARRLRAFKDELRENRQQIPAAAEIAMKEQVKDILGCLNDHDDDDEASAPPSSSNGACMP